MIKSFKFRCWNCPKVYSLSLDITDQQELIVSCPFCKTEGVVSLQPYRNKTETVLKGGNENDKRSEGELQLPNILPTKKPS